MRIQTILAVCIALLFTFPLRADIASISGDLVVSSLSKNHASPELREAVEKLLAGNAKEAFPVLKKFADANDMDARYTVAKLYHGGIGVAKNFSEAKRLLQMNTDGGHTPSMIFYGELLEEDTPEEAFQLYKRAAVAGDILGMLKTGDILERGLLGQKTNPQMAFQLYEQAAGANNAYAMYRLAICYAEGIGTEINDEFANRHFKNSALAGLPAAHITVANRYFKGDGIQQDSVAAVGWLMRGANLGSTEAMVLLGLRLENGDAVGFDLQQAGTLYSKAAKLGNPAGYYHLALLYLNGKGTKADPVRAYVLLHSCPDIPEAKKLIDNLDSQLTAEQKKFAQEKIKQAQAETANAQK